MKVLMIGSRGQLGHELQRQWRRAETDQTAVDYEDLDITSPGQLRDAFADIRPGLVINAAAYTAVDKAESEIDRAFAVNHDGAAYLAENCAETNIPLIHVSTDFVFDGQKRSPYTEDDPATPLSVYGRSKAAGEEAVRARAGRHLIVRTAWLYGAHGHNFVKTILRLAGEREELSVVADQFGSPTSAADLAGALLKLVDEIEIRNDIPWGTYHYCGRGVTTWHGFAEKIVELARQYGPVKTRTVKAIPTSEYPTPAERPPYSALDCSRIRDAFGIEQIPWQTSLADVIRRIFPEDTQPAE